MTLSGAAALIYEVAASQVLLYFFNSSTYSVATVLCAFLFGLAAGSLVMSALLPRVKNKRRAFALIEIFIGLYALLFLLNFNVVPSDWLNSIGLTLVLSKFLISFAYLLVPTLLLGALFPLASDLLVTDVRTAGSDIGYLYSFDTFGAIAGAAGAGFFLIPVYGVSASFLVAGVISFLAGLLVIPNLRTAAWFVLGLLLFGFSLYLYGNTSIQLIKDSSVVEVKKSDVLFDQESAYGSVIVVPIQRQYHLFSDRRIQCSPFSKNYHMEFSAIVLEEIDEPVDVLHIGLGCGYALEKILEFDVVRSVDVIEINPAVVEAAVLYFSAGSFLDDPRVQFNLNDGFAHLRQTDKKYDVAIVTVQLPEIIHASPLYTVEFFQQVQNSLIDGGQFVTFNTSRWDHDRILFHTLSEVFESVVVKRNRFIASNRARTYTLSESDNRMLQKLLESEKEINRLDNPILSSGLEWIDRGDIR